MRKLFLALSSSCLLAVLLVPQFAMAESYKAATCSDGDVRLSIPLANGDNCIKANPSDPNQNPIYIYLAELIRFVGGAIGLAAVLMIIISGVQYMISAGNPGAIAAAKGRLSNAVIGLILFILLTAIINYLIPGGVL